MSNNNMMYTSFKRSALGQITRMSGIQSFPIIFIHTKMRHKNLLYPLKRDTSPISGDRLSWQVCGHLFEIQVDENVDYYLINANYGNC